MSARLIEKFTLDRPEKATIAAYAAIVAMTAGMTILIMSGIEGDSLLWGDKSWFSYWIISAGAISGIIGMSLARGWMGGEGILGSLRAIVGGVAIALIASVAAGLMIDPLLGGVYGPILLMTEFINQPWLAAAWMIGAAGAHVLLVFAARERMDDFIRSGSGRAVGALSRLSQENLYRSRRQTWR
ncbi:hypothetical protein [Yoonia sp. BS5-3]|uniref:Uncharacterized protein n=1 Tax=Yoonia phaeophyticola TaxID=3137369 RepID=A0ABZ2V013_9RHOB